MKKNIEYFIRTKGKAEFKTYHLINNKTFDMLDVFFNSEFEAHQYASKKSLIIVEFKEKFETEINGK
nr:hypothetical protein [uncultured Emticicia sp.]